MMGLDVLEHHQELIRQRSRGAWLEYVGRSRVREGVAYAVAIVALFIAALAVALALRAYSSVIVQTDVRTVDRYGQTIGHSGAVYRIPAALETHAFLSQFITNVFTVYDSGSALQRDYAEAQAAVDSQSTVDGTLKGFWDEYSPLRTDLSWDRSREQERMVAISSILDRGIWSRGAEEYEVEWTVSPVFGDGHLGQATPYKGDIAVMGGAQRTDANPWGLLISHFSWSELR